MISNNVYYFNSGTTWIVPDGVTGIQVECYGSAIQINNSFSQTTGNYPGGSYSKSNVIDVTGGSTVYMNIGSSGGNTWFNTTNTAPTSASSTSSACLAVGGNTASASQIAANCGDVKYKGGNGLAVTGFVTTASGGQAGPNGNGADVVGPFTNTADSSGYVIYSGGGANGGSSGSLGVPPYGRSGTGTAGSGAYWNGSVYIAGSNGNIGGAAGFMDTVGQYSYLNNILVPNAVGLTNYGPVGGSATVVVDNGDQPYGFTLVGQSGFIVVTLLYGRKFIVINTIGSSSFTVPSDFSSLVSLEAVGAGGNGNASTTGTSRYGGGGGGGYSRSTSVTAPIVAGSTIIYANVPPNGLSPLAFSSLNVGIDSIPTSNTTGVVAYSGANASLNTGGAGATTSGAVGTAGAIFGGGAGGAGSTTSRFNGGGGGGSGGPLGAGGAGGAANNTTANRGGGGGGGANGGATGGAGTATTSGNGGTGSSGAGAGGNGNSQASPNGGSQGSRGPSGGGGGGGGGFGFINSFGSGAVNNSVYQIGGGNGGFGFPFVPGFGTANWAGAGGGGNPNNGYQLGGSGLVVFTYVPTVPATSNGNFFFIF
jgi:hypothetical protein